MKKIAWLTDIHLNFLEVQERKHFYHDILKSNADIILISGDIAEAPSVSSILKEMAISVKKPIYFVLGNHDYYRGHIDQVKEDMLKLMKDESLLSWLPVAGPQLLEENLVILGQDGWADGRYGDYHNSKITLNDSRMIVDLFQKKILSKEHLLKKMQELADIDAQRLSEDLEKAVEKYQPKKIIVLTHVPPFKESCLHQGKISNDDWLPYFSSKVTGDVLMEFARKHFDIEFLVLSGHTHSQASYQALDNLLIKVGKAEYYKPTVEML